jgi:hypothetical protein
VIKQALINQSEMHPCVFHGISGVLDSKTSFKRIVGFLTRLKKGYQDARQVDIEFA